MADFFRNGLDGRWGMGMGTVWSYGQLGWAPLLCALGDGHGHDQGRGTLLPSMSEGRSSAQLGWAHLLCALSFGGVRVGDNGEEDRHGDEDDEEEEGEVQDGREGGVGVGHRGDLPTTRPARSISRRRLGSRARSADGVLARLGGMSRDAW